MVINKTQYLKDNWQLLAALQWRYFERKGLGILVVKNDWIGFRFYDTFNKKLKKICDENPPQTHVIVKFYKGDIVGFEPPMSPQKCFELMRPQLRDFFLQSPE
ncbi:MAG: hypothetical protein WBA77_04815 [Microcoleaceae cyanobacterium]